MSRSAKASVAREVRELAEKYHVTAERDGVSAMAVTISRLAGDVVNLDATEQLLVNLKRKGVLSKNERIASQVLPFTPKYPGILSKHRAFSCHS